VLFSGILLLPSDPCICCQGRAESGKDKCGAALRNDPLPSLSDEPFRAFPSWFLVECDRCGKPVMHNEVHMTEHQRGMVLRVLLSRLRHEGCGGRPARAELLTGIDGVSSQPVRRIVLRAG
jgi:hypothetical protein